MKAKYPVFGNPEAHIPDSFELRCYENTLTYIEKYYDLDEQLANILIKNTGSIINLYQDGSVIFKGHYDKKQRSVSVTLGLKATKQQILSSLISEFVSQYVGLYGKDSVKELLDTVLFFPDCPSEQDNSPVLIPERMNDGTYRLVDNRG